MSCDKNIDVTLNIHDAMTVRESLFRYTAQDSYEFPGQRTIAIRKVIVALDERIEEALKDG